MGYSAPDPVSYLEIEAWSRLTGECPSREELAVLLMMDAAYVDEVAKKAEAGEVGQSGTDKPAMTEALFDAMFG